MKQRARQLVMVAATTAAAGLLAGSGLGEGGPEEYYHVEHGRVDRRTYTGWQIFRENCAGCHGQGAVGTPLAPSLVERVRYLSIAQFRAKVLSRYFITIPVQDAVTEGGAATRDAIAEKAEEAEAREGDFVKMPPWRNNPDVRDHIEALYAYLTARADGVIDAGVPPVEEQQ